MGIYATAGDFGVRLTEKGDNCLLLEFQRWLDEWKSKTTDKHQLQIALTKYRKMKVSMPSILILCWHTGEKFVKMHYYQESFLLLKLPKDQQRLLTVIL
jgi:hypothetical protein